MLKPTVASDDKLHEYGIGFRLGEIDGHRTFGHGGAVYGYSTQLVGLPAEKVGVVASASFDGANGVVKRLTEYAVRLLLAKKAGQVVARNRKDETDFARDRSEIGRHVRRRQQVRASH